MGIASLDRMLVVIACGVVMTAMGGCAARPPRADNAELARQVADTERAFARTMADRNHAGFVAFLAPDTIFFSGTKALRGSQAVAEAWKRFYDGPAAPFSWKPETVEVLDSGTLALSSGPVFDPAGKNVATFTSIWRMEAPGTWRIVFDKGNDVCDCPKAP